MVYPKGVRRCLAKMKNKKKRRCHATKYRVAQGPWARCTRGHRTKW